MDQALKFQTSTVMNSLSPLRNWGYGFQFWKMPDNGFAMIGMGSQDTMCFPEQDMVITMNSDTQGIPNGSDMILNLIRTEIFEQLSDQPLPELGETEQKLWKEKLEKLELPVLEEWGGENVSQMVNGKDYKFYANKEGFYRMRLSFETDQTGVLEYENEHGNHQILFGMGNHQIGMLPEYDQLCASSGAWCSKDTFHVCCQMIDEFVDAVHFKLVFAENGTMTILMKKTEESKTNKFHGIYTAVG